MKFVVRFSTLLCLLLTGGALFAQTENAQHTATENTPAARTTVDWEPDTLFFGDVYAGAILLDSFKVTNTGEHPYIIRDVKASCDCTVLKFPRQPVMPGDTAIVRVEFDSAGKAGLARPGIVVYDNSIPNSRSILYLEGYVISRKKPKNPMGGN